MLPRAAQFTTALHLTHCRAPESHGLIGTDVGWGRMRGIVSGALADTAHRVSTTRQDAPVENSTVADRALIF